MPDEKTDKEITCRGCSQPFVWTAGEQEFFERKGFQKEPKNCKPCRIRRRAEMEQQAQGDALAAEDVDSMRRRDRYNAERSSR